LITTALAGGENARKKGGRARDILQKKGLLKRQGHLEQAVRISVEEKSKGIRRKKKKRTFRP